jgi:hypothetical protein
MTFLPTDMVMQQMGMAPATTPAADPQAVLTATAERLGYGQFANEDGLPRASFTNLNYDNDINDEEDEEEEEVDIEKYVDLHSVPLHPSAETQEAREAREREERAQEERDARMLFEGIDDDADEEY